MGGVCVKGNVTMLPVTFTPLSFAQFNYFYYLCRTKEINTLHTNPLKPKVMIIKHLQGRLPTSASSVNAMCGACRHSCYPFRNDHLPFFLRHRQARRRNQSAQQNGERRATLALCAILITTKKNRRRLLK